MENQEMVGQLTLRLYETEEGKKKLGLSVFDFENHQETRYDCNETETRWIVEHPYLLWDLLSNLIQTESDLDSVSLFPRLFYHGCAL